LCAWIHLISKAACIVRVAKITELQQDRILVTFDWFSHFAADELSVHLISLTYQIRYHID